MRSSARIESRVQALEAQAGSGTDHAGAQRFCDNLLAFVECVFPVDPQGCRMDDLAKLCGLPGSRHMRPVIDATFSEEALRTAAMNAYGKDWRDAMKATLEQAVGRVLEVFGDEGLEKVARTFPPVLRASSIACERTDSGEEPKRICPA